jgi:thioredoxin 1
MAKPINISDAEFETTVLKNTLPVVVDFWAPWCGPCRMVAPVLDKLANEYDGKLVVAKVNTDEHSQWAARFNVRGIPTMLLVRDGKVVEQIVGAYPEPVLRQKVKNLLGTQTVVA